MSDVRYIVSCQGLTLLTAYAWEKQVGRQFRYFRVFENKPIDGAHKLADALGC